jgi:hypothetical protein
VLLCCRLSTVDAIIQALLLFSLKYFIYFSLRCTRLKTRLKLYHDQIACEQKAKTKTVAKRILVEASYKVRVATLQPVSKT